VAEAPEEGVIMKRVLTSTLRSALLLSLVAMGPVCVAQAQNASQKSAPSKPAAAAPAASGQAVYEKWCAPCHAAGPGHPGTQSLQLKYAGKTPAVLLDRADLTAEMVSVFVRQGILMMAPFRKTEISDAELAALSAYVARNYKKP
jgi:mono/diheme cytochrome c family protein